MSFLRWQAITLLCLFTISATFADENSWPAEISDKDHISLYKKLNAALKQMRQEKKQVSLTTFTDNKLYKGDVIKVGKTKFTIEDYKGKQYTLDYNTINANYVLKIIPDEDQKEDTLYFIGLIFLHEGDTKSAKVLFERAVKDGYSDAQARLDSVSDELNSSVAEKNEKRQEELEKALALKKEKEEAKAREKEEKNQSNIPLIASFKSDELKIEENTFPGKYTIFKFGAPW